MRRDHGGYIRPNRRVKRYRVGKHINYKVLKSKKKKSFLNLKY